VMPCGSRTRSHPVTLVLRPAAGYILVAIQRAPSSERCFNKRRRGHVLPRGAASCDACGIPLPLPFVEVTIERRPAPAEPVSFTQFEAARACSYSKESGPAPSQIGHDALRHRRDSNPLSGLSGNPRTPARAGLDSNDDSLLLERRGRVLPEGVGALPLSYGALAAPAGFEPATSPVTMVTFARRPAPTQNDGRGKCATSL
jgi:hypothetical protein